MKKAVFLIAIVIGLFTLSQKTLAQGLDIGLGGGLTFITSPEGYTKDIIDDGLDLGTGYNLGLRGRLSLPVIPIVPTFQVLYHKFSGEGQVQSNVTDELFSATTSQDIFIVGAGLEYGLIPVPGPINSYLAFDLYYTNIGEINFDSAIGTISSDNGSKMGIGLGAGATFTAGPTIDIDVSLKYNMFNLIGKEDGEETLSAFNLSAFFYFSVL